MDALTHHQIERNIESRALWDTFEPHRRRVTDLLRQAAPAGPARLCVLGAGNCNDLDLTALHAAFAEICLVDVDTAALADGARRQGFAQHAAVRCVGGIDLTGMFDTARRWTTDVGPTDADLAACVEQPSQQVVPAPPAPFDVTVSACLLTQILHIAVRTIGDRHARFLPTLQALRAGHVRLLVNLTAPGGTAMMITDLVSSDTLPALAAATDDMLPPLLAQAVASGNFFHGVNPAALSAFLRTDPAIASQISDVTLLRPWRWDFGARLYAVYACTFRKRGVDPDAS